jgi:type IV/VI secretion system ImpK/VasF family protein
MREEIANLIHPVLARGLDLRDRLLRGEQPSLAAEQATLLGLLLNEREARRWPEYGGDPIDQVAVTSSEVPTHLSFLGARYALVCWLDELFILDTPWSQSWNEHKLEVRLYASNDRAWKFWDQAKLASDRTSADALEVCFLCVMLGFTGDRVDDPSQLVSWIANTREQLRRAQQSPWRAPPGLEPMTRVPPLRGRQALKRMLLVASIVLLTVVPIVALFIARHLT